MNLLTRMLVKEYNPGEADRVIDEETVDLLREVVGVVSHERNYYQNSNALHGVRKYIVEQVTPHCENVFLDGPFDNIVVTWGDINKDTIVIGGHYDGPENSPGADDNGSAIAVLVALAKALSDAKPQNIALVFFNVEEHGLRGSIDFTKRHPEVSTADGCVLSPGKLLATTQLRRLLSALPDGGDR